MTMGRYEGNPRITLPEGAVAGTFAVGLSVNFQRGHFVLDFVVHDDRKGPDDWLVVQRVRLEASAMQEALAAMSTTLTAYEQTIGPSKPDDGSPPVT